MKRFKIMLALALCAGGCTSFRTEQRDETFREGTGEPTRQIVTTVRGTAWFSSAQSIAKLKATQTDKTQSVGSDSIGQQGATNTVATLDALANVLQALRPTP